MLPDGDIYKTFALDKLGLLPRGWVSDLREVSEKHSRHTQLDGRSVTSREPEGISPIDVYVVTGDVIYEHLRWLYNLYSSELADMASSVARVSMTPSNDRVSAVNITILTGIDARYEWHVDSNPLTGVLYVTSHAPGDGGELIFRLEDKDVRVYPEAGTLILFDGRSINHAVAPLRRDEERISIPMNFYFADADQERPSDLDPYLYRKLSHEHTPQTNARRNIKGTTD